MKNKRKLAAAALVAALLVAVYQLAMSGAHSANTAVQNKLAVASVNGGDSEMVAQQSYESGSGVAGPLLAFLLGLVFLAALRFIFKPRTQSHS